MFLGFSLFPFLDACLNPEEPVLESPLGVEVACERRLSVKLLQPAEHMQLVLTDFFHQMIDTLIQDSTCMGSTGHRETVCLPLLSCAEAFKKKTRRNTY